MNIKKSLLLTLSLLGVAIGGLTAFNSKSASVAEAADYSTSAKDFKLNTSDSSVSATFTVSNSDLGMRGWLLCLLTDKPEYDLDTRKLDNSNNLHPFGYTNCVHYFYAACTQREGKMSITWAANAADQKIESLWNEDGSTDGTENLAKYMTDGNDYHIVIGPRHYEGTWQTTDQIGNGKDNIWENCDYYVGRKNSLLNGVDGQTYLDLSELTGWEGEEAKFGFYYFDDSVTPKKEAWSEGFATASSEAHIYRAQYSLNFVPKKMIAVRFNKVADELRWNASGEKDYVWNQGDDDNFYEYGVVVIKGWDGNKSDSYEMAGIKFSSNVVMLDHLKRNDKGHSENFNQYVYLAKNDMFYISFNLCPYNDYETYDALADNFKIEDGKIKVLESGLYSLYFDKDALKLYITSGLMSELDEWCQFFLGDNRTCVETKSNWTEARSKYDNHLSKVEGATEYLRSVEHVSHDAKIEGYIALAMQRYDFLVSSFEGYTDYLGRSNAQNFTPYSSGAIILSTVDKDATIIVIVSFVTLAAVSSLFIIRKKKSVR